MNEVECRLEVDIDDSIPLGLAHSEHKTVLGDTRIVHEHVNVTEISHNLIYNFLSLSEISSVGSISLNLVAESLDFLYGLLCSLIDNEVSEGNISTL